MSSRVLIQMILVLCVAFLARGDSRAQEGAGASSSASATQGKTLPSMKAIFPIGVWFDGRVEGINCPEGYHNVPKGLEAAARYYEANFTDIRNHGIEIVVIPNTPPDYRETLLAAADKVGVRVVLELVELAYVDYGGAHSVRNPEMTQDEEEMVKYCEKIIAPLRGHPSLFCYQVLDEPPAELFKNFSLVNRVLRRLDPAHRSFSCLCIEGELDRTAAMGTQMIVFDRYPLRKGSKPGDYDFQSFIVVLEVLKKHSTPDRPYWMVVQTCAMDRPAGLRYPSAEEVRAMTWLSLAHNAKGIFFFLHNSFTQEERLQGLVDLDMKPHPIYAEVAELSVMLKRLAPLVLSIAPSDPVVQPVAGFDVQSFKGPKGERHVFVTNLDVLTARGFKGRLADGVVGPARWRNVVTGETIEAAKAKETERAMGAPAGEFTIRLRPGEGCLLTAVGEAK